MLTRFFATTLALSFAGTAGAQSACSGVSPIVVGSERERYLRVAQLVDSVDLQPWTLRPFSFAQARALIVGDSALLPSSAPVVQRGCNRRFSYSWWPAQVELIYNSEFPFGSNDGAVWAGRGFTTSAQAGFSANVGALSWTIAPLVFVTQNASFELIPNGMNGARSFASWRFPDQIDLPQRFGSSSYHRFDFGQSEVRVEAKGVAIGLSSANQYWGPATEHPILLGNNAAGIPRLFLGTSRPANIPRVGGVHGQLFWGIEGQSAHSPLADSGFTRLASGINVVYQPAFLRGMEIGAARFFHVLQRELSLNLSELARPFGSLLLFDFAKQSDVIAQGDNQLASVFFRYVSPGDGMEIYGELGREDHANTLRELLLIPDHDMAYLIGLQKAWRGSRVVTALRAEVLNSRVTHLSLSSQQSPLYQHATVRQGHTNYGQALGSVGAHGGGASIVALEQYGRRGRQAFIWERREMGQNGFPGRPTDQRLTEVQNILAVERFRTGRQGFYGTHVALIHETNRYQASDGTLGIQVRFHISWPTQ